MQGWRLLLGALCWAALAIAQSTWENVDYERLVDLSKSYVKESIEITAENVADVPLNEYVFTVIDGFGVLDKISVISFIDSERHEALESENEDNKTYVVKLPIPISPGNTFKLRVRYVYYGSNTPFPEAIDLPDTQSLLLKANKFAYSPYKTKRYSLGFRGVTKGQEMFLHSIGEGVATPDIPEVAPRVEELTLAYGPVDFELEPYTVVPMGLLYEHNRPMARAINYNSSVWIPAIGVPDLPVEESYDLTNDAAKLNRGFLRIDWMKGRYETTRDHWALSHLDVPLEVGSDLRDFYYTDLVGKVDTSKMFDTHLLLAPRFPLFGGWKFNFTIGWNYPIEKFVHYLGDDTYIAKFPLVNSVRDIVYDNIYLSFYLPENAEFLDVASPIKFELLSVGNEFSYMDVNSGRTKVTLHYKNLYDDVNRIDVYVTYKNTTFGYFVRIAKVAGFIFTALTAYYLINLVDISIVKST